MVDLFIANNVQQFLRVWAVLLFGVVSWWLLPSVEQCSARTAISKWRLKDAGASLWWWRNREVEQGPARVSRDTTQNLMRHTSRVTRHASHVTRHASHVTRHASHVTRHTSHVTPHASHVTRHTSHVTRQTSHVTRHTSHVTRHTSHVTRHTSHLNESGWRRPRGHRTNYLMSKTTMKHTSHITRHTSHVTRHTSHVT